MKWIEASKIQLEIASARLVNSFPLSQAEDEKRTETNEIAKLYKSKLILFWLLSHPLLEIRPSKKFYSLPRSPSRQWKSFEQVPWVDLTQRLKVQSFFEVVINVMSCRSALDQNLQWGNTLQDSLILVQFLWSQILGRSNFYFSICLRWRNFFCVTILQCLEDRKSDNSIVFFVRLMRLPSYCRF